MLSSSSVENTYPRRQYVTAIPSNRLCPRRREREMHSHMLRLRPRGWVRMFTGEIEKPTSTVITFVCLNVRKCTSLSTQMSHVIGWVRSMFTRIICVSLETIKSLPLKCIAVTASCFTFETQCLGTESKKKKRKSTSHHRQCGVKLIRAAHAETHIRPLLRCSIVCLRRPQNGAREMDALFSF